MYTVSPIKFWTAVIHTTLTVLIGAPGQIVGHQTNQESITINSTLWEKHTKPPVVFMHKKHQEKNKCDRCHHDYKDGINMWNEDLAVLNCQKCHDEPTQKGEKQLPEAVLAKNLKVAYHTQCVGCHRTMKRVNKDTKAPTTCNKCHKEGE